MVPVMGQSSLNDLFEASEAHMDVLVCLAWRVGFAELGNLASNTL